MNNWLAILCAGVAYWVLGYVWYSLLFGKTVAAEMVRHRGEQEKPSGSQMGAKLLGTFISNLVAAAAMAYLLKRTAISDINHVLKLAAAGGIGFAGTAITMSYIWDSKPTKVWMIDVAYYFLGPVLMAMILVNWPW